MINISTGVISDYTLEQNFPNPFSAGAYDNPETVIRFELPTAGEIRLELYSPAGERLSTLAEGFREAGVHSVRLNGEGLASGIYYYTLRSDGTQLTRKMILLR